MATKRQSGASGKPRSARRSNGQEKDVTAQVNHLIRTKGDGTHFVDKQDGISLYVKVSKGKAVGYCLEHGPQPDPPPPPARCKVCEGTTCWTVPC